MPSHSLWKMPPSGGIDLNFQMEPALLSAQEWKRLWEKHLLTACATVATETLRAVSISPLGTLARELCH